MAAMALRGAPISELAGLGDKTLGKLREHGIESVEQLAQMTPEDLMQIQGVGEKTVERIRRVVTDYFERDQSGEGAAPEGTEAPIEAEEGEIVEAVETSETPDAETTASSAAAEETSATEEPADTVDAAGQEPAEEPATAEASDKIESPGEDEPQGPEASSPAGAEVEKNK
jgi:N utilization substance protein A